MTDWIKEAQMNYPNLFRNCYCGFSAGDGWKDLLLEAFEKLNAYPVDIIQIKEKFGTLRLYTKVDEEHAGDVYIIISDAEQRSAVTCEQCGKPGTLRSGGWMVTLCDDCDKGREKYD